jgi:hypothetical protein
MPPYLSEGVRWLSLCDCISSFDLVGVSLRPVQRVKAAPAIQADLPRYFAPLQGKKGSRRGCMAFGPSVQAPARQAVHMLVA